MVSDPMPATLDIVADRDTISAAGKDSVRVMVRALDQVGNKLPFLMDPVQIEVSGVGKRVGPGLVPMRGGSVGFWLESTGTPGKISVSISSQRFGTTTLELAAQ